LNPVTWVIVAWQAGLSSLRGYNRPPCGSTGGVEVDFLIEQNGRVRLIEAKWAETVSDP
jgi:hypothetical protein